MQAIQTTMFDYAALDAETRIVVQQRIARLHDKDRKFSGLMRQTIETAWEMGEELYGLQQDLDHGLFLPCLRSEFPHWSQRSVYRFIDVYRGFKFANLANLEIGLSAAYLLAAGPESARIEAIARAEEGEPITHSLARGIIHDHKEPALPFEDEPLTPYEQDIADRYFTANPDLARFVCSSCGEVFDIEVWHCPRCDHHWQMHVTECRNCHEYERPSKANHQLINASSNNEWYTPRPFLDAAHEVMGGVDLDPASNDLANDAVRAERYYTINDDGYTQPWHGRVWLNPPYGTDDSESNQARWSRRLIDEYRAGNVSEAILLVNAVPGNGWFAPLKSYPICFPDKRIRFYNADTEAGQPTHSNALVYFGPNVATFVRVFSQFGAVMARLDEYDGHIFIHGIEVDND